MEHDFELEDLKIRTSNVFGNDARLDMHYNFGDKVFNLQVPTKRIDLAGLTCSELKFYLYGYSDAIEEA